MPVTGLSVSLVLLSSIGAQAPATKPGLVVLDVAGDVLTAEATTVLSEVLAAEVDRLGRYEVVSGNDVEAMLGFERAKELAGCDALACFAEIGGALGAERILVSSVGRLGESLVLTVKVINIGAATTEGRIYEVVDGPPETLVAVLKRSLPQVLPAPDTRVEEATPPERVAAPDAVTSAPSGEGSFVRTAGLTLTIIGGAAAILGGVFIGAGESSGDAGQTIAGGVTLGSATVLALLGGSFLIWSGVSEPDVAVAPVISGDSAGVVVAARF